MNALTSPIPIASRLALLLGVVLLALATYRAVRGREEEGGGFGWAVVGGLAYSLLGMAAALRISNSLGLAAALAQLLSVALAVGLGVACAPAHADSESGGSKLVPAGRMVAWLTLIGLPPTLGFHAKLLLYRALAMADFPWAVALALGASWVLLLPALRELRSGGAASPPRARVALIVALIALIVLLGLAPYLWLWAGGTGAPAIGGELS